MQARGAHLLAGLQEQLGVKAHPGAVGLLRIEPLLACTGLQHQLESRQIDRVLAFVVGCAPAIPAIALSRETPGIQTCRPAGVLPADHVAMPVAQHRGVIGRLDALGDQHRTALCSRVRHDRVGEAHALQRGNNVLVQVARQFSG